MCITIIHADGGLSTLEMRGLSGRVLVGQTSLAEKSFSSPAKSPVLIALLSLIAVVGMLKTSRLKGF